MASLIFKALIILGYLLGRAECTGHLFIDYEYYDSRGRDSSGDLCDYCFFCYNPCDPLLSMCLRFGHTSGSFTCSSSRIEHPQIHSQEYVDTDKVTFGSSIGGVSNPVYYSTPNWFNGLFEISIVATDEDGIFSGDDDIDKVTIRLAVSIRTSYSPVYTFSGIRSYRPTTAAIRYKFFCDPNYYGGACTVFCQARDDTSGHYHCHSQTGAKICYTGYTGPNCDVGTCGTGFGWNVAQHACVDIDECTRATSQCEQICMNNVGSYTCGCSAGYQLYTSFHCRDIDECTANPCEETCTNTVGSYRCTCGSGYRVDTTDMRRCIDIDECLGNSGCDHNCVNTPGTYYCGCRAGYLLGLGGACNDINECTLNTDQCQQLCHNTIGSYSCSCFSGYYLASAFNCARVNFSLVMSGIVLSSSSIRLTWTTTYLPSSHPVSLSYQVWLRDITFSASTPYTNHAQTPNNLQIDASSLLPYRRYQLYIRAVSGANTNDSNSVTLRTQQDSPGTGPSHVEGLALDAAQIRVYWSAPSRESQNGLLTTYTILYTTSQQRQMNVRGSEITVSASTTSYTLTGLAAYADYWLGVAASTSVGTGPFTNRSAAIRTRESTPTAAPVLTLNTRTSTSITLTLQPPTDTALINGVTTYYLVSFAGVSVDTSTTNLRVMPSSGNYLSPVNGLLSPLQEGVSYTIRASMYTSVGGGPFSSILTITTLESVPAGTPQNLQFTSVRTTSLSLSWDLPLLADQNGAIVGYRLSYRGDRVDTMWRNTTLNTDSVALSGLEEGCRYIFYICAFTSVGDGPCLRATHSTLEIIPSGAPTMLTIENVVSTAISVSWSPPSPSQQNGMITGYNIVAIGQKYDNERFEANVNVTYQYQLTGLEEDEGYSISIRAGNSIGYGPAAEINVTTSQSTPYSSPRNVTGSSQQTTITLTWVPIPDNQQNGQLINYEINYYTLTSFISHVHVMINVSNALTQYTITGLEQHVEYILKVRAYTSVGPGPYSPEITVTTQQSQPSSAPTNLQAEDLTDTQIQVTWDPPLAIDQNGPITQYQILLSQTTYETLPTNNTYTTSQTIHTINALHPSTSYSIQVRAENSIGAGPYTPSVTATTREAIPSAPPTHLTLISVTHNSANISWRSPMPDSLNGALQAYTLNITNTQTSTSYIETSTTAHTRLDTLTPNSRYSLAVAAVNSQGTGPYTPELFFSTQQSPPTEPPQISQITDNSPHSISLQWGTIPTNFQNGAILSYTVNISTSEDNRFISSQTVLQPTTTATFSNLHPYTEYTLAVSGDNAAGTSPPDYETHTTEEALPTGAPTSLSTIPSFTSITLSWQPPNITLQNGRIIEYSIRFQSSTYTTNTTQYVITGLEEFTTFQWSVAAWNSIGVGPYSQVESVSTLANPPSEPPQNVTARALSYQSIFVSWEPVPLSHQNGQILNYIVYFQRQDKKDDEMKQEVDSSVTSTTISSLNPFLSYTIFVVCKNTEGSSPQSTTITVMTLEGSPSAAPTDFSVVPTSSTTASVSWVGIPPSQHNGVLTYYEIVYQGRSLNTAIRTFRALANQTGAVLSGLHPAVEYTVYIRAFTQVGNGPDSPKLSILLPESIPNAAPTIINSGSQSDSISLVWSLVNEIDRNGVIINYELRYSIHNTNNDTQYTYLNFSASTFDLTLTDLLPNTYLEFEIRAATLVGPGPYSSKYFISTKPHICTVCANGNCVQGLNGYSCECNPGYAGEACTIDIDDCIGNECEHSQCMDGVNGYTCECESGYKGQLCDILLSTPTCPKEVSLKFVWPETLYSSLATLPCSDFDAELYGNATRECDSVGSWSLVDLYQCKRKLFDTLAETILEPGMIDLSPDELIEFSHDKLCNGSSHLYLSPPYSPSEMNILVTFINGLVSDIENQNRTIRIDVIKRMMPGILCILSNVLDARNLEIFSLSNATKQAIALSDLIERIAKLNAQNYDTSSPNPLIYSQDNIQMFISPLTDKQSATIPDYTLLAVQDTSAGLHPDSVYIPESEVSSLFSKANGGTPVIALVFSRYLGEALGTQSLTSSISEISTRVITVQSSLANPLNFISPITLIFTLFPTDFSSIKSTCLYWDVKTESWSDSGLALTSEQSDRVSCSSIHATSFVVLTSQSSVVNANSQAGFVLGIGATIGAILFLILAIIICFLVICSWKLRQRRTKAYIEASSRRQSHDILNVADSSPATNPLYGHINYTFNISTRKELQSPEKCYALESNSQDMYQYYSTKLDPEVDKDAKVDYDMINAPSYPQNSNDYSVIVSTGINDENPYSEIAPDPAFNPFIDLPNDNYEKNETEAGMNYNPFVKIENNASSKTSEDDAGIVNPTYQSPPIGTDSAPSQGEQPEQ